jgi:hypothetical protein
MLTEPANGRSQFRHQLEAELVVCQSAARPPWERSAEPLALAEALWPHVRFFGKQVEIIESVRDNDETFVVAANQVGKDFVGGFIAVWAFLCHPVARVITTSVKDDHLRVLWSEISRFIQASVVPLEAHRGGPLVVNHRDIRKAGCPVSYLRGMVSERGEGLAGHHAPYTLLVIDEASGVDDVVYTQGCTWAKRVFVFGNPNPTQNFFYRAVQGGDIPAKG